MTTAISAGLPTMIADAVSVANYSWGNRTIVRERLCKLFGVARFIHLNGPPGIGKSTIAKVFADQHPGVLNLDIDQVVALIGGWQDMFSDAFEAGRLLAAGMARTHLTGGHDVIMPQLITNPREMADFEAAVDEAEAEYCHIVLMAGLKPSLERFRRRTDAGVDHDILINEIVEQGGGQVLLRKIYNQLAQFLDSKQVRATINCESQSPEQTYDALEAVLKRAPPRSASPCDIKA